MIRTIENILISIVIILAFCSCVETETTRTTKKVDASQIQEYKVDMNRSRLRVALSIPENIEADIRGMLSVEVDDGQHRYGFPGTVFTPDTSQSTDLLYAPWVNTPDTGKVVMSFKLAYGTGANLVTDHMTVELKPERFWLVRFGIVAHDPCPDWPEPELCRTYTLPRSIEASGNGRLYVVWEGGSISVPPETNEQ